MTMQKAYRLITYAALVGIISGTFAPIAPVAFAQTASTTTDIPVNIPSDIPLIPPAPVEEQSLPSATVDSATAPLSPSSVQGVASSSDAIAPSAEDISNTEKEKEKEKKDSK